MNVKINPIDINIDFNKQTIRIVWQDGLESNYPFATLRKECPCAVCNELRTQQNSDPLRVLSNDQALASGELDREQPVQVVGQYALQFFWVDGHRTGIYTYQYLRDLAEAKP